MDRAAMFGLMRDFMESLLDRFAALAPLPVAIDAYLARPEAVDWDGELAALLDRERRSAD